MKSTFMNIHIASYKYVNCLFVVARHPGGHERGVPEVRLSGFSAHPQGEPRERTGESNLSAGMFNSTQNEAVTENP